ncbi:regenerating islet-derived protein 3-alpha-like isoform X1 [Tenrec ecaudatus]|uniref:regenerating islet-derived protein 3-alpha-like isoform X1 n=1 Tax=Tenrec ecaudatus TaxID=94439 RepID=UPI003F5A262B
MLPDIALPSVFWMLLSCLMLPPQVQGADSQIKHESAHINCPRGSNAYGPYCYALFLTPKSWIDAEVNCQRQSSGSLVSVLDQTEGAFVASLVKSDSSNFANVWIGLHDPTQGFEANAGGWQWSNRDILNYFAWERDPSTFSRLHNCGILSRSTGFQKWKGYNCDQRLPYVCMFKN